MAAADFRSALRQFLRRSDAEHASVGWYLLEAS